MKYSLKNKIFLKFSLYIYLKKLKNIIFLKSKKKKKILYIIYFLNIFKIIYKKYLNVFKNNIF